MLLIAESGSVYDFAQNINLAEDVLRIRVARLHPKRSGVVWFGLECRTQADSRLERDDARTRKMLTNGRQIEDTGGPDFHPIKN